LKNLPELMDRLDPTFGVGPRGVHAHYITCLNRSRTNGLTIEEGAGVKPFRKLRELVLVGFRENWRPACPPR
jgi:hypothetical protein